MQDVCTQVVSVNRDEDYRLVERYPQLAHGGGVGADEGVHLSHDGIVLVVVVVVGDPGVWQGLGVQPVLTIQYKPVQQYKTIQTCTDG